MALLFMEGFEQYSAIGDLVSSRYLAPSAMPAKWSWNTTNYMYVDSTGYKTAQPAGVTSKSLRINLGTSSTANVILWTPACATMIFGLAYQASSLQNQSIRVGSASTPNWTGSNFLTLNINSSGQLTLYNNRTSTYLVATATGAYYANVWYYLEVKVVWGLSGSAEVKVDGLSVGTATSVDTRTHTSDSAFQQLGFGVFSGAPNVNTSYYDDIYVCNDSGATHNDFLGPVAVYTLFPTANGTANQFTPTGVASNWDAVNEQAQDASTTYVASSTPNQVDKYNVPDLPVTPTTVHAVTVGSMAAKSESSARQYRNNVTVGGTTSNGATVTPALNQYNMSHDLFVTAPGGSAWTASDVNSMEIGVECF